ncbi:MAG: hypothetical protein FWE67_05830 [Planctomycetaceae bacterium]|nr:hypothetical protein [Planctomycetaceae bacterium]
MNTSLRDGNRCKTSIEQFPKLRNYKDLRNYIRARGSKIGQFAGITTRPAIRDKLLERPAQVGKEDNPVHRQSEPSKKDFIFKRHIGHMRHRFHRLPCVAHYEVQ